MAPRDTRRPGKAGSWYAADPKVLREQLGDFLGKVPDQIDGNGLPVPGARVIIAPSVCPSLSSLSSFNKQWP